jgi:predicted NUDIX family phosphoesterase
MSSREIATYINKNIDFPVSGKTPWKTVNARISAEILEGGQTSRFIRVGDGKFALRIWPDAIEYTVSRRTINPVNEIIAVVPRGSFLPHLKHRKHSEFFDVDYIALLQESQGMQRIEAEGTEDFVQLIPLFFVRRGVEFLTYKRTRRLPEKRLHGTRSINFGGHLQVEDFPSLFASDPRVVQESLQRELREELQFEPDEKTVSFFGAIHDQTNMFGRQHVGLVFEVTSNSEVNVDSNEPGFLTSLRFEKKDEIYAAKEEYDDWTFLVLDEHMAK